MTSYLQPNELKLLAEAISSVNPKLGASLLAGKVPTNEERGTIVRIVSRKVVSEMDLEYEPNDLGRILEKAIQNFLCDWPWEGN
jgi:hypothetical protein